MQTVYALPAMITEDGNLCYEVAVRNVCKFPANLGRLL